MFKFLSALEVNLSDDYFQEIIHHLSLLRAELLHYFLDAVSCADITDPFSVNPADLPVGTGEQEEPIYIFRRTSQQRQNVKIVFL